ncbi:MAG TPA: ATP-binding protein [Vicinamibacterales bacterium]|nr:ATP-binding protein [Vicinamibacterales bacterium]
MGSRIRDCDWTRTPLGPPQQWPQTLRTLVAVMLGSRQPMFIAWGPARTMLYNDGYAPLCGAKHPAALGRPFSEVWADIIDVVGPIMDDVYRGIATHMDDIQFTMRDRYGYSEETHFEFSYTPVTDGSGSIGGMFCACNETTERVIAARHLRFLFDLSDRLRKLTDPATMMRDTSRALGMHLEANRVGYAEVAPDNTTLLIEHDWVDGVLNHLTGRFRLQDFGTDILTALDAGQTVRIDDAGDLRHPESARRAFQASGAGSGLSAPVITEGLFVGALFVHQATPRRWRDDEEGLVRDVAARTWHAIERARSERKLRDEHARKDEFLATLAHELRNPLAPLRSGLGVLNAHDTSAAAAEKVRDMMARQLAHMVRLIDDLLDVSRVSRGLVELRKERVDVKEIATSAIETSLPIIDANNHRLSVSLASESLPVDADPTRLAQVLSNLLNNAAKYTPAGGHITLAAARDDHQVVIRVVDTGVGIPQDMLRSVFDMFTQVGDAEHGQGGLGIGLTLVRRLTEMHGGTVTAESSPDGSTFTVRLPLAEEPRAGLLDRTEATTPVAAPAVPLRVLIVDDNVDAVEMLAMLVELQGHTTASAHNGVQAVSVADAFQPDVIFLDIGLPGLDGYQVAREIRQRPVGAHVLLVALTGWGSAEDKNRTQRAGFDLHFTKPVEPEAVERLLVRLAHDRATHPPT